MADYNGLILSQILTLCADYAWENNNYPKKASKQQQYNVDDECFSNPKLTEIQYIDTLKEKNINDENVDDVEYLDNDLESDLNQRNNDIDKFSKRREGTKIAKFIYNEENVDDPDYFDNDIEDNGILFSVSDELRDEINKELLKELGVKNIDKLSKRRKGMIGTKITKTRYNKKHKKKKKQNNKDGYIRDDDDDDDDQKQKV